MRRILLLIGFLCFGVALSGQPIISFYLDSGGEISRGRPFASIEESHELLIKGASNAPVRVEKRFNSQGNIVYQRTKSRAGGTVSETKWEYIDGQKFARKHHRYFVNIIGWREDEVIITYCQNNHKPEKIEVKKEGKLFQYATITTDSLNRIESVKVFLANGPQIFTERLRYLHSNNMIRVFVYKANEQFYGSWAYPLDPTKEFHTESMNRVYYPNGDIKIETLATTSKTEQAYYYEYEYDAQGNWIEKETYQVSLGRNNRIRNKKLEHRITRTITYQ